MGFIRDVFGGGGGGQPQLLAPELEPEAKEFQAELYPRITRGLRGEGLTPEIDEATRRRQLGALEEEFPTTRRALESFVNRTIPRGDIKVRSFLKKSLEAQFARQRESIEREGEFRGFEDVERSQNLAFGAVGAERGIAGDIASMTNQSILRRAQDPTFGTELFGGLGTAAGFALGGRNRQPGVMGQVGQTGQPSNFSSAGYDVPSPVDYANRFSSSYKTGLTDLY